MAARATAAAVAVTILLVMPGGWARATGSDPEYGETTIFATVAPETHPEGTAVEGRRLFVSTTVGVDGPPVGGGEPSKIYVFDRRDGSLEREIVVEGENVQGFHGIGGLVIDGKKRLYAADAQGRVLRFVFTNDDVRQETYATVPDLKPCYVVIVTPCSPTADDRPPLVNDIVFDAAGNLYATDSFQATVFRIPPGANRAQVWLQDEALDGPIGANGIEVTPDGRGMYLAVTGDFSDVAKLYRLPLVDAPSGDDLQLVRSWKSGGLDGLAFGKSGRLYATLYAYNAIAVLAPDGSEITRIENELYDEPATIAFDDPHGYLLVPNHAFMNPHPEPRKIVRVFVDDQGAALARPMLP